MKTYRNDFKKRWHRLSFFEQMANVGSEVERAIKWQENGNDKYSNLAFKRALELLDFTIEAVKELHRLRELLRLREALVDYFAYNNLYRSSAKSWHSYFFAFNYAARLSLRRKQHM